MLVVQVLPAQPCLKAVKRNNAMKLSVKTSHWNPRSQKDFFKHKFQIIVV